ncbi:prepilin-type N-terminal cleavage/methylation domain-containing protein [Variovorax sp. J22R133]|uniref:GspH/FimT family pseudopilin n=1 Tax=Variovorax brevis TaxID=3053503 RepID=UPI0025789CC2|nr:GspH/FimT family pseudopilin [Variovorax sp. J22R133]MDM0114492.1 prepilin-type N-terminal cleavage/methylation domain-containing protein [Variovorax sp. J22R133]
MPTSAAGNNHHQRCAQARASVWRAPQDPAGPGRKTRGFTLIELLVVIAIIALAMSGVGLALRDSGQATIDREAERLAALFESARAQSRASGMPVRWHVTEDGFTFEGVDPGALPSQWLASGMSAQAAMANGRRVPAIQLGPEPIIAAQQVVLTSDGPPARTLVIATDGLRPFAVTNPP